MQVEHFSSFQLEELLGREWLCTSGNGGYASSTACGLNTRKYHGLLVAAMAPPVRRMVLLSRVEEMVRVGSRSFALAANEYPGAIHPQGHALLRAFDHDPFPRWAYQGNGWTIEKQLRLPRGRNAVVLTYTLLAAPGPVELELRPLFALRGIHELTYQWNGGLDARALGAQHHRIPASSRTPEAFFAHDGEFAPQACWYLNTIYRAEQQRGYAGLEDLWMPGVVGWKLAPGQSVHFICASEPIDFLRVLGDVKRQQEATAGRFRGPRADRTLDALLQAAEQFVVSGREQAPAIISAYPWGTAAGRDAMICLPGLLLVPGKLEQAGALLKSFAGLVREGLMPAELAEDGSGWRYTAADTALWFIHALGQYVRYGGDGMLVRDCLLPAALRIIEMHRHGGCGLGVGADAEGLLRTEAPGIATTWMDAGAGDWVVTPRQGRPVSLNALWYNAICTVADLCREGGDVPAADELDLVAMRVKESFNRRFWNQAEGCCHDVVKDSGVDSSIRPNQLLAISLPHAVLDIDRHARVLQRVGDELLTPMGVRTISPGDPAYHGRYGGPVLARERSRYQGSALAWLLGPMVGAHLRVHGRGEAARAEALQMLRGCLAHLQGAGHGQLCELFDGDEPHGAGGAAASARSVAEVLRCYVEDVLDISPAAVEAPRPAATGRAAVSG
jgi:predicted glycogen debranching enzyme